MISRLQPLFIFTLLLLTTVASAELKLPRLSQPVHDVAGLLPNNIENQLNGALKKLRNSGGSQIQVLILPSLEGQSIEQTSIEVTGKWKLGGKDKDNGVLLLVAQKERKIRIEVGQGLEGKLTDAYSKRIIAEVMVPLFREGHFDSGILLGVVNIVKRTDPGVEILSGKASNGYQSRHAVKKKSSLMSRVFSGIFFILMLILFIKNPSLFFLILLSGGRGRGGFGGGGSGGGWSGGGGGFSGGGASGGW